MRKMFWKYIIFGGLFIGLLSSGCKKEYVKVSKHGAVASNWKPGDVFFDEHKWTECDVGNMPIVISIPHGGTKDPKDIPDRACPGNIVTVTDGWTISLGRAMEKALEEKYNLNPYLIICHLRRRKVDQNRALENATCGHNAMDAPWYNFHHYVDTALANVVDEYGYALYIDLHAHGSNGHPQRLELGYSLRTNELGQVYLNSGLKTLWQKSTLNNAPFIKDGKEFKEYLMGEDAFGTMMGNQGFESVPSKQVHFQGANESFFNGGYNSRRYTSSDYPNVFGWQIESNYTGVRDTKENRAAFGEAFADVIMQYLNTTMNYNP